ncbi:hypothetical protein OG985_48745 (plasmid) [Streptomyces sp. NBC_00289]|uniref:hypothetical protein n=1 Tax=Streptomyces sp. NBC_00289 TaxID=2975703 RepID=UPI002F90CCF7
MPFENTVTITGDEHAEIFNRLAPYLPSSLKKVEPNPSGWGLRFTFAPFTGREARPSIPAAYYDDPRLRCGVKTEDPAEQRLRRAADTILGDIYEAAAEEWKEAAYVADVKAVVQDAPERWRAYEREAKALESAYAYLRQPEAAREWPAAVSRLIDAQDRTRAAADIFEARARDIARVHAQHLYADLGHTAALEAAGYPEAGNWHIGDAFGGSYSNSLTKDVARRIREQEDHLAKVARLSGTTS